MKKMKKLMLGSLAVGGLAAVALATRRKDTVSIVLKENLAEGYLWMYSMSNKGIIEEYRTNYVPAMGEEGKASYGKHKWSFVPLAEGETVLTFTLSRPWDENTPDNASAVFRFTVDSDKKLKCELIESSDSFKDYSISVG